MAKTLSKKPSKKATKKAAAKASPRSAKPRAKPPAALLINARDRAVAAAINAHETLHFLLEDFPADQRLFMPSPTDSHVLWQIGHLTTFYAWTAGLLGAEPLPISQPFNDAVGYRSVPKPDSAAYPSFEDVLAGHKTAWDYMIAAARGTRPADLLRPLDGDNATYAADRLTVIERIAWHEGWHTGQISAIRRALGLKPKF